MIRRLFSIFAAAALAVCAMPALATDHTLITPVNHFGYHSDMAWTLATQGNMVAAFFQPVCAGDSTMATAMTHGIFVNGGGLYVLLLIGAIGMSYIFGVLRALLRPQTSGTLRRSFA